jgi:trans-4-hydroxy-L-proline dehydratase
MVMEIACGGEAGTGIWRPSERLSARVKRLREEYFSFDEREHFRNEVLGFSTGEPGDIMFSPHQWGVAPEVFIFAKSMQDTLAASAAKVALPAGFWRESLPKRRALFFAEVITKHLPVQILEGELVVGAHFNTALSKTLNARESEQWQAREKKWYRKNLWLIAMGIGNCGAIPGHLIPDYPSVIKLGFRGLAEKFKQLQAGATTDHRDFLDALIVVCEAVPVFAERYAKLAEREAEKYRAAGDPARAAELTEIARVLRKVPWGPPETFPEAVQALWLTHMLVMAAESYPGPGLSPGRVDQYLYPFYQADLEAGRLTREQARELLQCWFIKHNYAYDFMGRVGTTQGINSGFGQLITLGGCGPEGEDRANDLTLLLLDVIEDMNLLEPKPNVRLHQRVAEPVLDRVVELVAKAQGSPFLMNFDELSMRALRFAGLPEAGLWDYAPVGCLENTFQGNDRSGTVDVNLNLAKAVELTLGNGRDLRAHLRLGPKTGDPRKFDSYGSFQDAFFAQLNHLIDTITAAANEADAIRARFEPTPYLSALVGGCAESGRDVSAGGPTHSFITLEAVAFATAVDSLAAVKRLVFDEKRISMKELLRAVKKNFAGCEALRATLLTRAPKYGNDDPEADAVARDVNRFFSTQALTRVSPATGRRYRSGYLSWNYWIMYAATTAATPDGRPRGTYLSNGICPVTGVDRKGPVAVARSVARADLGVAPNGGSHTISFNPGLGRTEKGRANLKAYLRGYAREGGSALQINMIDPATLLAAQKDPDQYANLLVRVTGYNAYFTALGKELQDEIIARESFRLGGEG